MQAYHIKYNVNNFKQCLICRRSVRIHVKPIKTMNNHIRNVMRLLTVSAS